MDYSMVNNKHKKDGGSSYDDSFFSTVQLNAVQPLVFSSDYPLLSFRGNAKVNDGGCYISDNSTISLDTYFNLFSIESIRKYTNIERLFLVVRLSGEGVVELYGVDNDNNETLLSKESYKSDGSVELLILNNQTITELEANCFIRVRSIKDTIIYSGGLYTELEASQDINLALCFCTYKREQAISSNIDRINSGIIENKSSVMYDHVELYVADNGQTLDKEKWNCNFIHIYYNKNYGGSAGFTRCMIEAVLNKNNHGVYSHLVLIDDDAVVLPEVIERTGLLLRYLKNEYMDSFVGGALLSKDKPYVQIENGSNWDGMHNSLVGANMDLTDRSNLLFNQLDSADYNAWFYCCIPTEFIREDNLPIPFFIHGDDIEYGLRNKSLIRMNGICIWHPNPLIRNRPYMLYYDARNFNIIGAVSASQLSSIKAFYRQFKQILFCTLMYRYQDAEYLIKGVKDYFKGISWLMKLNPEDNNKTIMNWKKYDRITFNDKQLNDDDISGPESAKKINMILNWFIPSRISLRCYYDDETMWRSVNNYSVQSYALINRSTKEGYLFKKDYKALLHVLGKSILLFVTYLTKYKKVSVEYRDRINELRSCKYWKYLLGI